MKTLWQILQEQWPMFLYAIALLVWSGFLTGDLETKIGGKQHTRLSRLTRGELSSERLDLIRQTIAIAFLLSLSLGTLIRLVFLGGF